MPGDVDAVRAYYGDRAAFYDLVARYAPGVRGLRARAADALALRDADSVLELGCGTGANAPFVRERAPGVRHVGVDLTPGVLARARDRDVDAVLGDAATLPVSGPFDAVLGTFVVGLFTDPEPVVDRWLDVLRPGGRLVLLEAVPSPTWPYRVLNPVFDRLAALGSVGDVADPGDVLAGRVDAATRALGERATVTERESYGGFARLVVAEAE